LNVSTGRFWTADSFEGRLTEPLALHRYLYAGSDPINRTDPSGREASEAEVLTTIPISVVIAVLSVITIATACIAIANLTREGLGPCTTRPPEILYHYTAVDNLDGIVGSLVLLASPTGVAGPGQYFTDIQPAEAETHTKVELEIALFGLPGRWRNSLRTRSYDVQPFSNRT
jgi:hypothetical protein